MHVVQQLVIVANLQRLPQPHPHYPGPIHALPLIDHHRLLRNRRGGKRTDHSDEDVAEMTIDGRREDLLNDPRTFVQLSTLGIDAHPDDRVAGHLARGGDGAFDSAGGRLSRNKLDDSKAGGDEERFQFFYFLTLPSPGFFVSRSGGYQYLRWQFSHARSSPSPE